MCGIAGIHAYRPAAPRVARAELFAIRDHMAQRGPDGAGAWLSPDERVGLAHRRLSIIDLSDRGAQPMASADGGVVITFNGEVYNWRELRRDLQARGHVFRTESDTEVLLQLYAEFGTDMLTRIRGMFAFALWDGRRQALLLARDAFGIKPLYIADQGGTIRFASQVKALLAGGAVDTQPDPAGHAGFFLWGSVPAPHTLYRGIRALPAGHFMWVTADGAAPSRSFCSIRDILASATDNPASGSREDALDAIAAALRDSVAAHHVSDVPVALFLSSGLDSAMLAALSCEHGAHPRTLTLAFDEYAGTAEDEAPMAAELAHLLGTRHAAVLVSRGDFETQGPQLFAAMDQPSIDGINSWFVSRAARLAGIKVALSGVGGDELFASYPSFRQVPALRRLARPFAMLPFAGRAVRRLAATCGRRLPSPKLPGIAEYGGTWGGAYMLRRGLFMPWEHPPLLDPASFREGLDALQTLPMLQATAAGIRSDRLTVSALEMSWYMRNQLLVDTDWASMSHSLEVRVPFLDVPLLQAVAPWLARHPGIAKAEVARHVAPKLPRGFLERPKTGFSVPVRDWLMGSKPERPASGLRDWAARVYREAAHGKASRRLPARTTRVALWSPEMATAGGIQNYMWRLWEMLGSVRDIAQPPIGISLMDRASALVRDPRAAGGLAPRGSDASKLDFARQALGDGQRGAIAVVGHLHHAPLAWFSRAFGVIRGYVVVLHGIEAWARLPAHQRWALRRADCIVATTQYTASTCAQVNALPTDIVRVIPLCAEPRPAEPAGEFTLDGEFPVLFVGRLARTEKYKGLETLIEAVLQVRQHGVPATLHVVGDGNDRPRLVALAASVAAQDAIRFHGRLTDSQLQAAYASAKVFAMPSAKEGFGIVFLEAMRHGLPCIGGAHGGTPEVLRDGVEGFLVPYGDAALLADRLHDLFHDPARQQALGQAGRARFEREYAFDRFARRWGALLDAVAVPARKQA